MRLNFKTIIVGGVIFYAVQWVIGMISGIVLHGGVLEPLYKATAEYWRPELMQDPPDMAALMPRWIATGLAMSFIFTGIYTIYAMHSMAPVSSRDSSSALSCP